MRRRVGRRVFIETYFRIPVQNSTAFIETAVVKIAAVLHRSAVPSLSLLLPAGLVRVDRAGNDTTGIAIYHGRSSQCR